MVYVEKKYHARHRDDYADDYVSPAGDYKEDREVAAATKTDKVKAEQVQSKKYQGRAVQFARWFGIGAFAAIVIFIIVSVVGWTIVSNFLKTL